MPTMVCNNIQTDFPDDLQHIAARARTLLIAESNEVLAELAVRRVTASNGDVAKALAGAVLDVSIMASVATTLYVDHEMRGAECEALRRENRKLTQLVAMLSEDADGDGGKKK